MLRSFLLIALTCGALPAQPPVLRYEVKRTTGRMVIDGKLETWVKIKNRQYGQAVGRANFFDRRKPTGV
jgi:hypothetical protein